MDEKTIDIMGIGTVLVDHQVLLPEFPKVDTKNRVSSDRHQIGGPVPTALAMATKLGKKCEFAGRWADDAFGSMIERDLMENQIRFSAKLVQHGGSTGFAHVWIDQSNGTRTIAYSRGEIDEIEIVDLENADAQDSMLPNCRFLHVDGWSAEAAVFAARRVRANGGQVFFDAGSPKAGSDKLIPHVDYINCPTRFAREYFGTDDESNVAEQLLSAGVKAAIFTHGANGASLYTREGRIDQPGFPIKAVDTTGAGDVFCGGMLSALLDGKDLQASLKFAAATAALKCQRLGNREALPARDLIEQLVAGS